MQGNKTGIPSTEPFVRRHRPFFVTLFVLIPVLIMPVLLIYTMVKSDSLKGWCTLYVFCDNSYGLKQGNQVSMSGITIGHVRRVDLIREGQIHVMFDISNKYRHAVKKDTKARLKQRGFVGDWEIELSGGKMGEVDDGDTLSSERAPSIDWFIELAVGIIDTATNLLNDIAAVVRRIEAGEGTVGQLINNDSLLRSVDLIGTNAAAFTSDAIRIARDLRGTIRTADSSLFTLTSAATHVVTDVGKSGTALVDSLMTVINTVHKTLEEVEPIIKNVKTVSDDAPELMDRLQRDLGDVEMMLRSLQDSKLMNVIGGGSVPKNPHLADSP
ncbi:MAG: MlaD family protein [Chitinispirillia bacterium]|nr:MlaD family protein [Chitinispirillia bacterium]MCL2267885.1 MlaD family protein [Chitinispirillia bacterium]